jgi:hypothetical protein
MNPQDRVAYQCYEYFGATITVDERKSVVDLFNASRNGVSLSITEGFFYEETIASQTFIMEAEWRSGFVSRMAASIGRDLRLTENIDVEAINAALIGMAFPLTRERLKAEGLKSTTHTDQTFGHLLQQRLLTYLPLLGAAVNCRDEIPEDGWRVGLQPRDFPLFSYLGTISDNLWLSLADKNNVADALSRSIFESILFIQWKSRLQGLANFGVWPA